MSVLITTVAPVSTAHSAALQTAAGPGLGPQPASEHLLLTVDRGHDEPGREEAREDAGGGQEAVGGGHQPAHAAAHGPGLQTPEVLTRHASRAVTRGAALVTRGLEIKWKFSSFSFW